MTIENKLIELGLKVWERGDKRRIYINRQDFGKVFGLELGFYKTGNISSAFLNGEAISNSKAYKLIGYRTPYYDCVSGDWHDNNLTPII